MGLGGAANDQSLVTSGQTLLVVTVVKTKSDQGGAGGGAVVEWMAASGSSRFGPFACGMPESMADRAAPLANRMISRARHAIVLSDSLRTSNSTEREISTRAMDLTGNALTIHPGIPSRPCGQLDKRPLS